MAKKSEPRLISFDDMPRKFISAPVADVYQEELTELYFRRKSKPGFEDLKMNPASEKFYRLYFYQGLSQADRVFLHQEYLETQSRRFICTFAVLMTSLGVYALLGQHSRYSPFKAIRLGFSGGAGYLTYKMYKNYTSYLLEEISDPYYEKYAIR